MNEGIGYALRFVVALASDEVCWPLCFHWLRIPMLKVLVVDGWWTFAFVGSLSVLFELW
jgi:hypothetical protein